MVSRVSSVLFARTKVVAMSADHSHQLSGCSFLIIYFLARDFGVATSALHSFAGKLLMPQIIPEAEVRTFTAILRASRPLPDAGIFTHLRIIGWTFSPIGAISFNPKSITRATLISFDIAFSVPQIDLKLGFSSGVPVSTVLLEKEKRQPSTAPSLSLVAAGPVWA